MIYTFKYIRFQKFVNSILYLFKINFIFIPLYIPRKQSMLFLKHASMLTGHIYLSRKAGTRKWLGASWKTVQSRTISIITFLTLIKAQMLPKSSKVIRWSITQNLYTVNRHHFSCSLIMINITKYVYFKQIKHWSGSLRTFLYMLWNDYSSLETVTNLAVLLYLLVKMLESSWQSALSSLSTREHKLSIFGKNKIIQNLSWTYTKN